MHTGSLLDGGTSLAVEDAFLRGRAFRTWGGDVNAAGGDGGVSGDEDRTDRTRDQGVMYVNLTVRIDTLALAPSGLQHPKRWYRQA
jgi:hypothetical protein